jgi:hypothetical protein
MPIELSYEVNADKKAIDRIRATSSNERGQYIVDIFSKFFANDIKANPKAFTGRFRKMASSAFNFYRGSALLFYQDLKVDRDQWIAASPAAGNIFIHVSTLTCFETNASSSF